MPFSAPRRMVKIAWLLLVLFGIVILLAALFVLYTTAKLQKNLLSKSPAYSGQQLYASAEQQIQKGDYSQAESYLRDALSKEDDSSYRNQLAVVEYRLRNYAEAIVQYQKLIQAKQDPAFAFNGIDNAYRDWALQDPSKRTEREQLAITAYHSAISADAHYSAAYSNLALLLASENKQSDALVIIDQGYAITKSDELQKTRNSITGK